MTREFSRNALRILRLHAPGERVSIAYVEVVDYEQIGVEHVMHAQGWPTVPAWASVLLEVAEVQFPLRTAVFAGHWRAHARAAPVQAWARHHARWLAASVEARRAFWTVCRLTSDPAAAQAFLDQQHPRREP